MGNNIWNKHDFCRYIRGEKFKIFRSFKYFCRYTKWSYQRITRGYADCDWWDMDSYLQQLIPDMLKSLKKNRHGSPVYLRETDIEKNGCTTNDSGYDAWDQILDRMIFLWEESDETTCSRKNKWEEEHSLASEEFSEKYGIFGEKLEPKMVMAINALIKSTSWTSFQNTKKFQKNIEKKTVVWKNTEKSAEMKLSIS